MKIRSSRDESSEVDDVIPEDTFLPSFCLQDKDTENGDTEMFSQVYASAFLFSVLLLQLDSVLAAGLRKESFPDLGRIISSNHLHGLSHNQIVNHEARRKEKGLLSQSHRAWHLFCTRSDESQVNTLPEKTKVIEESMGIPLQVVNIDPEFACYSGHVESSKINDHSALLEKHYFLVQSLPTELKIHKRLAAMISEKSDLREVSDSVLLVIDFYRGENYKRGAIDPEKSAQNLEALKTAHITSLSSR